MPRIIGQPNYVKIMDKKGTMFVEPGDMLLDKCKLVGVPDGRFGPEFDFVELETGKSYRMGSSGKLKYMYNNGELVEGDIISIKYIDTREMEKGPYAGKEFHELEVMLWDDEELKEFGLDPNKVSSKKKKTKKQEQPQTALAESSEDDEDDEEKEIAPRRRRGRPKKEEVAVAPVTRRRRKVEEDDEQEENPRRKKTTTSRKSKAIKEDLDDDLDDDLDLDDLD